MAMSINLKKDNLLESGYVGFSWTTLFFGFFVPLCRGDWIWFAIILGAQILTVGLAGLVFCFVYNKIYTKQLLAKGYEPADEEGRKLLIEYGLISN